MAKKHDAIWIFNEGKMRQNISCMVTGVSFKMACIWREEESIKKSVFTEFASSEKDSG